jgi:hypothetical protein
VVVTFPDARMLDIAGPLEVFSVARWLEPRPAYRTVRLQFDQPELVSCWIHQLVAG